MTRATSSRAIGAKLHAMYGRRLTTQNFEEMLHKRSVGEIAAYLKNTARFAGCLTGVQESTIHRGQLEILLGRALFEEVGRLKGYDRGGPLFRIYYARIELEQITSCIGYLRDGRQEQFLVSVPGYLLDGIGLDLDGMVRARDAAQLARVLDRTRYGKAFRQLLADYHGALPSLSICAARLGLQYYQDALGIVERNYDGAEREQLRHILLTQVEVKNLTVVYRMKRYFGADASRIAQRVIPLYYSVRRRTVERLMAAPDAAAFERLLRETRAARAVNPQDFQFIEHSTAQYRLQMCHKAFQFTTSPAVAFLAFLTMREIELSNVLSIVEGVRYSVPADEIRGLLVML